MEWEIVDRTSKRRPNGRWRSYFVAECSCGKRQTIEPNKYRAGKTHQCRDCWMAFENPWRKAKRAPGGHYARKDKHGPVP